ncbi:MAG: hypothetical protein ACJA1Z_004070 [Patiriisocius sp.]|jgi:hypothetical protein
METSESWISCIFFVMNLINYQKKSSFGSIFYLLIEELELKLRAMVKQKLIPSFLPSIWTEKSNYTIAH